MSQSGSPLKTILLKIRSLVDIDVLLSDRAWR